MHEHGPAAPRNRHVDGDVLDQWRDMGGDLKALICDGTQQDVQTLFITLAEAVDERWKSSTTETDMDDMVTHVKQWMGEVLMPVL